MGLETRQTGLYAGWNATTDKSHYRFPVSFSNLLPQHLSPEMQENSELTSFILQIIISNFLMASRIDRIA